jgi:hypothetical protein
MSTNSYYDLHSKERDSVLYSIRSNQTDKYYVGSTYNTLSKRFYQHKTNYKRYLKRQTGYCSVFEILKYDDAYIEVLESHCGLDRYSLFRKEGEYIRNNKDKVVNIAGAKRRRVKQ